MNKEPEDLVNVKKDAVGIAADKYLELKEKKNLVSKELDKAEKALIKALVNAKRTDIRVGIYFLAINIVAEKTKIKVAKG